MIEVHTTPTGRQMLLSNLYIRNYLYGKFISSINIHYPEDENTIHFAILSISGNKSYASSFDIDDTIVDNIKYVIRTILVPGLKEI